MAREEEAGEGESMSDEFLELLGDYFIELQLRQRLNITFEKFVNMVLDGTYKLGFWL